MPGHKRKFVSVTACCLPSIFFFILFTFFFFLTWKLFSVSRSGAVADALVSGRVGILIKVFGCLLKLYAMHGFLWGIMMKAELNH